MGVITKAAYIAKVCVRRASCDRSSATAKAAPNTLLIGRQGGPALNTPAEQKEIYRTAGVQLASSRFCLVPAGDNEVSSKKLNPPFF